MNAYDDTAITLGKYIADSGDTVRGTAIKFGMAKSTVHKLVTERLMHASPPLYTEVRRVLLKNLAERHIRGGEATRRKYKGGA